MSHHTFPANVPLRSIAFTLNFIFINPTLPFLPGKRYAYMRYMRYVETKFHHFCTNTLSPF